MKITAKAPANIAFIKYWGKKSEKLRIPANSSISMNLSGIYTITSVDFEEKLKEDIVKIDDLLIGGHEKERVSKHLDMVRKLTKTKLFAKVVSHNNFPKGTGLASSASAFAALTLAATRALGLKLSERELSVLARLGSGSACRSIPDGFVEWRTADSSRNSYAYSLYPPDYWCLCDLVVVVDEREKKVSSSEGHKLAPTSPFYKTRINRLPATIKEIKMALARKDFTRFGEIVEKEALNMHSIAMTSTPPLFYWQPETVDVMAAVVAARKKGIEAYFTLDAGPNVHVICQDKDAGKIKSKLAAIEGVRKRIINYPSVGARLVSEDFLSSS